MLSDLWGRFEAGRQDAAAAESADGPALARAKPRPLQPAYQREYQRRYRARKREVASQSQFTGAIIRNAKAQRIIIGT